MNQKILYIGNKLSKYGYSVTSIETLGPQLESVGYKMYYASDKKSMVLRMIHMLYSVFSNNKKVDIVLIDTYSKYAFWYAYLCGIACRLNKLPYYPILRGGLLPDRLNRTPKAAKRLFTNSVTNIAPSGFLQHTFENEKYKVHLIPNNIDISIYPFKLRDRCKYKLLWVRSFATLYNPTMAIRLVSEYKKRNIDVELCMVGPDKDGSMDVCKDLAKELRVEALVTFKGVMSKKDWHKLSEDYDIFINTTNVDNTPISVIEAMALGLPVISTRVGGIPFLLKDNENALLIDKGDLNSMIICIDKLVNDSRLLKRIAQNGRKLVEEFAWDTVKEKWISLLNQNT